MFQKFASLFQNETSNTASNGLINYKRHKSILKDAFQRPISPIITDTVPTYYIHLYTNYSPPNVHNNLRHHKEQLMFEK